MAWPQPILHQLRSNYTNWSQNILFEHLSAWNRVVINQINSMECRSKRRRNESLSQVQTNVTQNKQHSPSKVKKGRKYFIECDSENFSYFSFPLGARCTLWRRSTWDGPLGFTTTSVAGLDWHYPLTSKQYQYPNLCQQQQELPSGLRTNYYRGTNVA